MMSRSKCFASLSCCRHNTARTFLVVSEALGVLRRLETAADDEPRCDLVPSNIRV